MIEFFIIAVTTWALFTEYRMYKLKQPVIVNVEASDYIKATHRSFQDVMLYGQGFMEIEPVIPDSKQETDNKQ